MLSRPNGRWHIPGRSIVSPAEDEKALVGNITHQTELALSGDNDRPGHPQGMFEAAIAKRGAPQVVHAGNGSAMTSDNFTKQLEGCGVDLTYSRPHVSKDNRFSESGFRTMRYRPGYPRVSNTIETARAYLADCMTW